MKKVCVVIVMAMAVSLLAGCGSYYKVIDPASKSVYYTEGIKQIETGAVKFKDTKTGSEVTLQSSEVKKIDSKEFEEATKPEQPSEKK